MRLISRFSHGLAGLFLLLTGLIGIGSLGRADVVVFKDGYSIQGKIRREMTSFLDPGSGQQLTTAKLNGFFMIDDEARRVVFSQRQVQDADSKEGERETDTIRFVRPFTPAARLKIPPGLYEKVTPFDEKWDREVLLRSPEGRTRVAQHLSVITPYYLRVDSRRHNWTQLYLTKEFEPGQIREILYNHPDLKLKKDAEDGSKRLKVAGFLAQAGFYDLALTELELVIKDHPAEKEKAQERKKAIKQLMADFYIDQLEKAVKTGRPNWARVRVALLARTDLDEKSSARVKVIQGKLEASKRQIDQARDLLGSVLSQCSLDWRGRGFDEAAAAILSELNADTAGRLEAFVGTKQSASGGQAPDQHFSLAISGWLLGSNAAEAKPETALRLWLARKKIQEILVTSYASPRKKLITDYAAAAGVAFDEVAQMIRLLPPEKPLDYLTASGGPAQAMLLPLPLLALAQGLFSAAQALPGATIEVQAERGSTFKQPTNYLVQLPTEYHVGRDYPVLIVLHDLQETAEEALRRWSLLAEQNGYILAAPAWKPAQNGYGYTAAEQGAVLETIRDLRRRLQIDSDRVFLCGVGEGGANMAYDVGLSHPDQFAGIIPLGGRPRYFATKYWRNAQMLPFYLVDGELSGYNKEVRRQLENWIPKGYPVLFVEYRGRGQEWFDSELPAIFEWMSWKKRARGLPNMGQPGEEMVSMRQEDNTFYWISGEGMGPRHVNDASKWNVGLAGAALQGRVSESNQINLHSTGFKRVVVWLAQGMVDFEKPLTIYVNSRLAWQNKRAVPSMSTLLEHYYQHGDRQRLFVAKIEL